MTLSLPAFTSGVVASKVAGVSGGGFASAIRYAANPIIKRGAAGSFDEEQIFDLNVITNPTDSTKLIGLASGLAAPVATGIQSIGLLIGSAADPVNGWGAPTVVLQAGASGTWDVGGVRMGSVTYNPADGLLYMFYTGGTGTGQGTQVGLATCPANSNLLTWTKFAGNPILSPSNDETIIGEPAVLLEGTNTWTMVYDYRTSSAVLPGYRVAYSSDAKAWTKQAGDVLNRASLVNPPQAANGSYPAMQFEFHQLIKRSGSYYLFYECGGPVAQAGQESTTVPYRIRLAKSTNVRGPFTDQGDFLLPSFTAGTDDRYHVATPYVATIGGRDFLYYSGAASFDQPYYNNTWNTDLATLGFTWLSITGNPPNAQVGTAYNFTPTISGGASPYTVAVASGALPSGLNLNATTGAVTGTPTATGSFTLKATDSAGVVATMSASFSVIASGTPAHYFQSDATHSANTPSTAAQVTRGDLADIKIDFVPSTVTGNDFYMGKWQGQNANNTNSVWLFHLDTGRLRVTLLDYDQNFKAMYSSVNLSTVVSAGTRVSVRALVNQSGGVVQGVPAGYTRFQTSVDNGASWQTLGADQPGSTRGFNQIGAVSGAFVCVGTSPDHYNQSLSKFYKTSLVLADGTIIYNPDFTQGSSSFNDTAGTPNPWTVEAGGEV